MKDAVQMVLGVTVLMGGAVCALAAGVLFNAGLGLAVLAVVGVACVFLMD